MEAFLLIKILYYTHEIYRLNYFLRCLNNLIRSAPNILSGVYTASSGTRHFFAKKSGLGIPPKGGQAVACCQLSSPDVRRGGPGQQCSLVNRF